tara:strand:- start:1699 stop:2649 length:951 start_codon:yes stop_codon:yes gene_type:complete
MLITIDGDGGGIGAHLRHYIGDSFWAEEMNIDHYCLHPAIQKYFSNAKTNHNILHEVVSIINNKPENLINIGEADTEEIMLALERSKKSRDKTIFISGKHHYSACHRSLIRSKSRKEISDKYREMGMMSNYLHALVAEKKKQLGLTDNYYGIQIRTFVDSETGRKDFTDNYSCILDQLVNEITLLGKDKSFYLTCDDNAYKDDIIQLLRAESVTVISEESEPVHSSYLFNYLRTGNHNPFSNKENFVKYLERSLADSGGKLEYCEKTIIEMGILGTSRKIISTYSSFPITASMLTGKSDIVILAGKKKSLPLEETF